MKRPFLGAALVMLSFQIALAQQPSQQEGPRTKLERFVSQDGAVIVKGFSTIGTIRAKYGGSITVESKEFTNAAVGKKEYGITVEVKEVGRIETEHTSYVDYDEIDSLLKGIDYISQVNKSATKLDEFEAGYRTRGDLVITTFSSGGAVQAAVSSGTIGKADTFLELADLAKLRALIGSAKTKLDSIRQ